MQTRKQAEAVRELDREAGRGRKRAEKGRQRWAVRTAIRHEEEGLVVHHHRLDVHSIQQHLHVHGNALRKLQVGHGESNRRTEAKKGKWRWDSGSRAGRAE